MAHMGFDVYGDVRRQNHFIFACPEVFHDIELSVHSVGGLFAYDVTAEELNAGNRPEKVAGKPQLNNVTLSLLDTVDVDVIQQAYDWFNKVYNIEGNYVGVPLDYKKTAVLQQLDQKGILRRNWQLTGVWPSAINLDSDFSYDSDAEFVTLSLTLQVDKTVITQG